VRINVNNNPEQRKEAKLLGGITGKGFRSGVSGNPKGRAHTRGLLKAAVAENTPDGHTVDEALADVLIEEALRGKRRLAAASAIFDRFWNPHRLSDEI
jgi:hypothetical protein